MTKSNTQFENAVGLNKWARILAEGALRSKSGMPVLLSDDIKGVVEFAPPMVISALIAMGADVETACSKTGYHPLHYAALQGRTDVASELLSAGANVNCAAASSGETPLHLAAGIKNPAMASMLLAHGADPSLKSTDGKTAAQLACKFGCMTTAQVIRSSPSRHISRA